MKCVVRHYSLVKVDKMAKKKRKTTNNNDTAYCVVCHEKVRIHNPKKVTLKNKRKAIKGTCPHCGTKVYRMG